MSVRILNGDCREVLATLPAESVHCVVTSPPYWGLRDYGVVGQLGMEASLGEHVEMMVSVFREVWRVLRKDGTLWLNYGDSYAASPNGRSAADVKALGKDDRTFRDKPFSTVGPVARPGGAVTASAPPRGRNRNGLAGYDAGYLKPKDLCGIPWRVALALQADGWWLRQDIIWSKPNPMPESVTDRCTKAHEYLFLLTKAERYYFDNEAIREDAVSDHGAGNSFETYHKRIIANSPLTGGTAPKEPWNDVGGKRNKRSVWEVATQPFSEAHFATFPPALIEPCIKAGTSERGCCAKCGAPWVRETERARTRDGKPLIGWSASCACNAAVVPATVLDPFGGAGTTGLVADRLQRDAILIELNPAYADMARKRIVGDAPLFASAAE